MRLKPRHFGNHAALHVSAGGGEEYEGPLDIVPGAVVAYGQRALSAAMLGQPIYRLRRDSDDAEMTFSSDAVTGEAPIAEIVAWLDGAGAFVKTWFDQSGNGTDATQETAATQPLWNASVNNGLPGVVHGVTTELVTAAVSAFASGEATYFLVVKGQALFRFTNGPQDRYLELQTPGSGNGYTDMYKAPNEAGAFYSDNTGANVLLIDAAWEFGANSCKINGVEATPTSSFDSGGSVTGLADLLFKLSGDQDAFFQEIIVYPSILSDPNRLAIRQNDGTYYGITL